MTIEHEGSTVRAVVRSCDGDQAEVEVEAGGCGRCHEEGGCGGQQLTQMFCSSPKTYRVENPISATVGDRVTVAITNGSVRRTANLAYGVPLIVAIIGAALGNFFGGDLVAIIGALMGLCFALIYVRIYSRRSAGNFDERPYIVSRS